MMNSINYIYLTFGDNLNNHSQAVCSILSIKKLSMEFSHKFIVYTDQPRFYNCIDGLLDQVEIRHVSARELEEWQGEYKFFWRVKIIAMLDSAKKDKGHLVYLDSDTFACKKLNGLLEALNQGHALMHLPENELSIDQAPDKKLMWQQTCNKKFGGMLVDEKSMMWNAGVVAIPDEKKEIFLNRALKSNDEMCAQNVTRRLIEQFSLSLSLNAEEKKMKASEWILHYWGNKDEWNTEIAKLFARFFQLNLNKKTMLEEIDIEYFLKIPIIKHQRSWNKKIIKFANSYWPSKLTIHKN